MTIYTAALTLILVMDPIGNIPVFLSILRSVDPKKHAWIMMRESFIAFLILAAFLFFGKYIMSGLHLTESALGISGGIILFLIALRMIFPSEKAAVTEKIEEEPFIVPMAVPLTAGPSAMAVVLLFATQEPEHIGLLFFAIVIAAIVFTIILLASRYLMNLLGRRGLIAMERLMGMILTTVAVQMFLSGLMTYFNLMQK